jgi:superoxide reductase
VERRNFIKGTTAISMIAAVSSTISLLPALADDDFVQRIDNKNAPTTMEQKHIPLIDAPKSVKRGEWFDVKVKVGYMTEHPSTPNHWIEEIKLIVNNMKMVEVEYEVGGFSAPCATFKIKLEDKAQIVALAKCNLHGKWASEPSIIKIS